MQNLTTKSWSQQIKSNSAISYGLKSKNASWSDLKKWPKWLSLKIYGKIKMNFIRRENKRDRENCFHELVFFHKFKYQLDCLVKWNIDGTYLCLSYFLPSFYKIFYPSNRPESSYRVIIPAVVTSTLKSQCVCLWVCVSVHKKCALDSELCQVMLHLEICALSSRA